MKARKVDMNALVNKFMIGGIPEYPVFLGSRERLSDVMGQV